MKLLGEACGSETYLRDFASQTQGKKLMVKFVPRQVDRGELEPLWPSLSRFRRYFGLIESVSSFSVLGQSTTSETDSISWYRKPCLYQCILPGFLLFLITVFLSTEKRSCILTWNFCPSYVCFHSMPTGVRVSKAWEVSALLSSFNADYRLQVTCHFYFVCVFSWLSLPPNHN